MHEKYVRKLERYLTDIEKLGIFSELFWLCHFVPLLYCFFEGFGSRYFLDINGAKVAFFILYSSHPKSERSGKKPHKKKTGKYHNVCEAMWHSSV